MTRSALLFALAAAAFSVQAQEYRIVELGALATTGETKAYGINDSSTVVGTWTSSTGQWPVVSSPTGITPVQDSIPLGGAAYDINNAGQIVGRMGTQAFSWTSGGGTVLFGPSGSVAYAVNAAGKAAGSVGQPGSETPFLWDQGNGFAAAAPFAGAAITHPTAINSNAMTFGVATVSGSSIGYQAAEGASPVSFGSLLSGANFLPRAINQNGSVIGTLNGQLKIWNGQSFISMGTPSQGAAGVEMGVNKYLEAAVTAGSTALLWQPGTGYRRLVDISNAAITGWASLTAATDINDKGELCGWGMKGGQVRAFRAEKVVGGQFYVYGRFAQEDYVGTAASSIQLSFYNAQGTAVYVRSVAVGPDGYFVTTIGDAGVYRVVADNNSHWLRRNCGFTNSGGEFNINLINGDISRDNEIGLADFGLFSDAFGSLPSDPIFNPNADLDGDGEIDLADFGILTRNWGQFGD